MTRVCCGGRAFGDRSNKRYRQRKLHSLPNHVYTPAIAVIMPVLPGVPSIVFPVIPYCLLYYLLPSQLCLNKTIKSPKEEPSLPSIARSALTCARLVLFLIILSCDI